MTDGTSQGLFIVVAIVIFGIFVVLAYILFEDTLSPAMANMFMDATEEAATKLQQNKLVGSWNMELSAENDGYGNFPTHYEFMQYVDLAPIFDTHGTGEYQLEFSLKTNIDGKVKVYMHSGDTTKYTWGVIGVDSKSTYQKYTLDVVVDKLLENGASKLAFFGDNYDSERFPTVKNVKIYKK